MDMKRVGFLAACLAAGAPAQAALDANGWTILAPSADSRIIYVNASGDDATGQVYVYGTDVQGRWDPFLPPDTIRPFRTPGAAKARLRHTFPDWMLFKKGDVFTTAIGGIVTGGRSTDEPLLIGAYGPSGTRPLFSVSGAGSFVSITGGSSVPPVIEHVYLVGLHAAHTAPGSSGRSQALFFLLGGANYLIEDCFIENFHSGASLNGLDTRFTDFRIRRNVFYHNHPDPAHSAHSQGVFLRNMDGLLLEENVFDNNGWSDDLSIEGTIYNHNVYIQNGSTGVRFIRNISTRASSHGVQMRPGGEAVDNFFARDAISLLIGGGVTPEPGGVDGIALNNVIMEGTNIQDTDLRRAIGIDLDNIRTCPVTSNLVASAAIPQPMTTIATGVAGVTYSGNGAWGWGSSPFQLSNPPDPNRSGATYNATLGGEATFDAFMAEVRAQSKDNWRPAYTAPAINNYIRQGFGMGSPGDGVPPAAPQGLRVR